MHKPEMRRASLIKDYEAPVGLKTHNNRASGLPGPYKASPFRDFRLGFPSTSPYKNVGPLGVQVGPIGYIGSI